jgi:hypothetical protein
MQPWHIGCYLAQPTTPPTSGGVLTLKQENRPATLVAPQEMDVYGYS